MTDDLIMSAARILGSVTLLVIVLLTVSALAKRFNVQAEIARKLIHISLGLYCLTFPLIFRASWEVAVTCALAVIVFTLARGAMRASLGEGLHGVQRVSYGEIFFAISVALLFELKNGHYVLDQQGRGGEHALVLYVLPIMILTLCDAASALVGSNYGKKTFQIETGLKSWEGVVAFVVTAWLSSLIVLLLYSNIGRGDAILLALIAALFGALLEAASWRGLDNLFIPLGLYFILANLTANGTGALVVSSVFFALGLALLMIAADQFSLSRHWLATAATLVFCIAIFSGIESTLTPATALVFYALATRKWPAERPAHDALNLLLTVLAVALAMFLISDFLRRDVIFCFNLAFACLAAGIVGRCGANLGWLLGACVVAWCAMAVRTLLIAGVREETLIFSALAFGAIILVGGAGRVLERDQSDRPWMSLGGLAMAAGLLALPMAPA